MLTQSPAELPATREEGYGAAGPYLDPQTKSSVQFQVETLGDLSPTPDVASVALQFQVVETLGNLSPMPEGVVEIQVGKWGKHYLD